MKQHKFKVSLLCAALLAGASQTALADGPIPTSQLISAIQKQLHDKYVNGASIIDVRPKRFKIVDLKIMGEKPLPLPYPIQDGATPFVSCSEDTHYTQSITSTDRTEVTLSSTESTTGSVTVEVGAEVAGVSASVAASLSKTIETGMSTTHGQEFSSTNTFDRVVAAGTGTWAVPSSTSYVYDNAPYEVTIDVTAFDFQYLNRMWVPNTNPTPLRIVAKGTVSGYFPVGKIGLAAYPIPADAVKKACSNGPFSQDSRASVSGKKVQVANLHLLPNLGLNKNVPVPPGIKTTY